MTLTRFRSEEGNFSEALSPLRRLGAAKGSAKGQGVRLDSLGSAIRAATPSAETPAPFRGLAAISTTKLN